MSTTYIPDPAAQQAHEAKTLRARAKSVTTALALHTPKVHDAETGWYGTPFVACGHCNRSYPCPPARHALTSAQSGLR